MSSVPNSMRRESSERTYQEAKANKKTRPLNRERRLLSWDHWILIENRFPYDLVFATHHMLIPKRSFKDRKDMWALERKELYLILSLLEHEYDVVFENTFKQRSVKSIYHLHLATWKQRDQVRPKRGTV